MALPIVPDFNPPNIPIGPINPDFRLVAIDPLPPTYFIIEQIKNKKTKQVWISARQTKNLKDGLLPVGDQNFQSAFKKFGKDSFVTTIIGTFLTAAECQAQLITTQDAVTQISKNNPSALGSLPVGIISTI